MAATTTLLGLVTPTQGTLSGTWGDTVNYGISDYVDIAIAGTLSFAGDGAITLANTTGSASGNGFTTTTAQYMVIRITGTQTVTKVITGPSYSKLYMVDHAGATSAVTFKAAGQTGVTVAVGEKCFVYYNGTDYVKVASSVADGVTTLSFGTTGLTPSTATSGAVTVAGTLATANGGTNLTSFTSGGVVYASSTSALATGSALTFDGTKQVVVGSSASALELLRLSNTESTGKQSIIGFLNAGLSNPTTKIYGGGTSNAGNGAFKVALTNESGTEQSIYESLNSVYAATAYSAWGLSGSELMRLTSTGLGIGTTSFTAKLTAKTAANTYTGGALALVSSSSTSTYLTNIGGALYVSNDGSTDHLVLSSAGNLGLGVTPSAWGSSYKALQMGSISGSIAAFIGNAQTFVTSNAYHNGTNWIYTNTTGAGYYQIAGVSNGAHAWYTAPSGTAGTAISFTQAMTLDASGNLGIGTTSPSSRLSIYGDSSDTVSATIENNNAAGSVAADKRLSLIMGGSSAFGISGWQNAGVVEGTSTGGLWLGAYNGAIKFATGATARTERARIDSSGNLLIGGTAARGTTVGTKHLDLFDGTAPAGTLTNGVSLYSSSGDLKFMNAAGEAFDVGYRNIPQNAQTGNYTLTLADSGDHIYHAVGAGAATYTIPANGSVAFPIGTAVTFINLSATSISIAITTDTMYLSSAGTTGTRTLAQYGSATAIKVTATVWLISGSGLT